jgi:hypothetical protein
VDKTHVNPLIVERGLRTVMQETGVLGSSAAVRLYLVSDRLPSNRGAGFPDDVGWTVISPDLQRIVCIVSLPGTMLSVKKDREQLGDAGFTDPRKMMANVIYRLSEVAAHELFHGGKHLLHGDAVVAANADKFEEEAMQYSQDYNYKVQMNKNQKRD